MTPDGGHFRVTQKNARGAFPRLIDAVAIAPRGAPSPPLHSLGGGWAGSQEEGVSGGALAWLLCGEVTLPAPHPALTWCASVMQHVFCDVALTETQQVRCRWTVDGGQLPPKLLVPGFPAGQRDNMQFYCGKTYIS